MEATIQKTIEVPMSLRMDWLYKIQLKYLPYWASSCVSWHPLKSSKTSHMCLAWNQVGWPATERTQLCIRKTSGQQPLGYTYVRDITFQDTGSDSIENTQSSLTLTSLR